MGNEVHAGLAELESFEESLKQTILEGFIEVPMLPEVANRALALAQDPDSDASEMAQLIQSDQSLAGHVMRIANSVAYTPLSNLVSLQQAIARLGMGVISEITLAAVMGAKLFHTPGYEQHVAGMWRHALATSLWAKEIARHCRSNVEVAFLSGLLHSIGRPAVLQAILDMDRQQGVELTTEQVHLLESKYCQQVSETVVIRWKMPVLVTEAVHCLEASDATSAAGKVAVIVKAGAAFASFMLDPESSDKDSLSALPELAALNLYQDEVEGLLGQMEAIQQRLEGLSS
jgi:HD-like signal output (HDOD) protein